MDTIWLAAIAGDDCPELLGRFTDTLALCEGRLLEQQLAGMDGMVSGLLRIQLPDVHADYAWKRLEAFAGLGLRILSRQLLTPPPARGTAMRLAIGAPFRAGLDVEIRQLMDSHGLAIDDFRQQVTTDGNALHRQLQIRLSARATRPLKPQRLQQALSRLAPGLSLDLETDTQPERDRVH